MSGLVEAMAGLGVETHLIFLGDPAAAATEVRADGSLVLHRWGQWISRYHPGGVYDGEWGKVQDYTNSVPAFVASLVREGHRAGAPRHGARRGMADGGGALPVRRPSPLDATLGRPLLVWNCNHPLCLDRVDWARLKARSAITTVSRYMRGRLLERGVDARVVPNGIPASMLLPAPEAQTAALTHVLGDRLSLVKVGRWDPNKGWLQAVDAGAQLRHAGVPVRLLLRGGVEPYGREVLDRCRAHGLAVREVAVDDPDPFAMVGRRGARRGRRAESAVQADGCPQASPVRCRRRRSGQQRDGAFRARRPRDHGRQWRRRRRHHWGRLLPTKRTPSGCRAGRPKNWLSARRRCSGTPG